MRTASFSSRRIAAIVTVTLLAGIQVGLYLADRMDDGTAQTPSLLIGIAILVVGIGVAVQPWLRPRP